MMITVACVTIDPYTRELRYACAGHLPPLLIDGGSRTVTRLDRASSPPLGIAEPSDILEGYERLEGPATVVLYTDGLIERRGHDIDEGIDLLATVFGDGADSSVDRTLDLVIGRLGPASDDVALLIVKLLAATARFEIEVPADSKELTEIRRRLRTWLVGKDIDESDIDDVILAVGEACNNAIEHAYASGPGTLSISVGELDGVLQVVVSDRGTWRAERGESDVRGRGLSMMRSLMHAVTVEKTPRGTRILLERRLPPPAHARAELAPT
jgi:anti-sigma regulatory factor (Ser/Thr protein kinase)